VVGLGENSVGGIESAPPHLRQVNLCPGVAGLGLRIGDVLGSGVDVPAHVPGRDTEQTHEADEEVAEVLTDAAPGGVDLEGRGGQRGAACQVLVLAVDGRVHVQQRVEEVVVVPEHEAHCVVGEVRQLTLRKLGREQEGGHLIALPRHPHQGERGTGPERTESQRIDVEQFHPASGFDHHLGEGLFDAYPADPVPERIVVLAHLAFHRDVERVLEQRLGPVMHGDEAEHVHAPFHRLGISIGGPVKHVEPLHLALGGAVQATGGSQRILAGRGWSRRANLGTLDSLADHPQRARLHRRPVPGLTVAGHRQRPAGDDDGLSALGAVPSEMHLHVLVTDGHVTVGRQQPPGAETALVLVGVGHQVAPVGEHDVQRAQSVDAHQPLGQHVGVGFAQ
jgi:hypothetical protein